MKKDHSACAWLGPSVSLGSVASRSVHPKRHRLASQLRSKNGGFASPREHIRQCHHDPCTANLGSIRETGNIFGSLHNSDRKRRLCVITHCSPPAATGGQFTRFWLRSAKSPIASSNRIAPPHARRAKFRVCVTTGAYPPVPSRPAHSKFGFDPRNRQSPFGSLHNSVRKTATLPGATGGQLTRFWLRSAKSPIASSNRIRRRRAVEEHRITAASIEKQRLCVTPAVHPPG